MLHVESSGLRRFVFATAALVAVVVALFAFSASAMAADFVVNNAPGCDDAGPTYCTIQAAIDAAAAGDTINIYPGNYSETALDREVAQFGPGPKYVFGLFLAKDNMTLQGVDASGTPITNPLNVLARITTNSTSNFGPSGTYVEGDNVTIAGLEFGPNSIPDGKAIDVNANGFTFKNSVLRPTGAVAPLFFLDWRYDSTTDTSYINKFTVTNNIFAEGAGVSITGGVGRSSDVTDRTISGNTFVPLGTTGSGIYFTGAIPNHGWLKAPVGGAVITGNVFSPQPYFVRATGQYNNAEINWQQIWNSNTFPKAVVALEPGSGFNVRSFPYSYSGANTERRVIGSQIQTEIDHATAGDTVLVKDGTYEEQISITKDLTLQGAGAGTIIKSPAAAALTTNAIYGKDRRPVVFAQGANVVLKDLMVDGDSQGGGDSTKPFLGVAYYNAGGVIQNVEIKNIQDSTFSGAQHGVALYAMVDNGSTKTLDVKSVKLYDFQKNGTAFYSAGTSTFTVNMQDSIVTGKGATGVTAQNGIQYWQIGGTLKGTFSGNTVNGIIYSGANWIATSILNYLADLDIVGNTVNGAHMGIYSIDAPVRITDNVLNIINPGATNGYVYGIIASDPPKAVPSPMVEGSANSATAASAFSAASATPLAIEVSRNTVTLSGGPVQYSSGIEFDAGYLVKDIPGTGTLGIAAVARNNLVSGFDYGLSFFQCADRPDCAGGLFASAIAQGNSVAGNGTGMYSDATVQVNGEFNWWGDVAGPSPISAASVGGVTGNIDFDPWLTDGTDTSGAPGFQPKAVLYVDDATKKFNTGGSYALTVPIMLAPGTSVYGLQVALNYDACLGNVTVSNPPPGYSLPFDAEFTPGQKFAIVPISAPFSAMQPGIVANLNFASVAACGMVDKPVTFSFTAETNAADSDGIWSVGITTVAGTVMLDFNTDPDSLSLSPLTVPENQAYAGTLSALDADDPTDTFSFVESSTCANLGADNGIFDLVGTSVTHAAFDFEALPHANPFNVCYTVTDGRGGSKEQGFQITVTNVNEAPLSVSLSQSEFTVNQTTANAALANFSIVGDPDAPGVFPVYTCSVEAQSPLNSFAVSGLQLSVGGNALAAGTYTVQVTCTDDTNPITSGVFSITVFDTASLTFGAETSGHSGVVRKESGALVIPVAYNANGNVPTSFKFRVNFDAACLAVTSTPLPSSSDPVAGWVQYDNVASMPVLSVTALASCPDNRTSPGMTAAMRADKDLSFEIVEYKKDALVLAIDSSSKSPATVIDNSVRGNCNASLATGGENPVNAADYVATVLEIFDNTSANGWLDAPMSGFDGSPFGCDSSQNGDIAANDIACTVHESFGSHCTATAVINPASAAGLSVAAASGEAGAMVNVPVSFDAQGAQIGALVFTLKLDPAKAAFDATDADGDGNPDAIQFNLVDGQSAVALYDAATSKINVAVFSVTQAMQPINGSVASVNLQSLAGGDAGLTIESASASTVDGVSVPVNGTAGGQAFLPKFFNYLPMLVK